MRTEKARGAADLKGLSALYVYDGFLNPGDCFSYCGVRHYLKDSGIACEHAITLRDTGDLRGLENYSGPDLLIFAGAPWLWDGCVRSRKYAAAGALLRMCSASRKVAVGAGSCFLPAHDLAALGKSVDADREGLADFWGAFDLVIVRDALAWWILDRIGIKSSLAVCPSVAVGDWYGRVKKGGGRAVLTEPLDSNFMFPYLSGEDKDYYENRRRDLAQAGAAEVRWIETDRVRLPSRSVRSMCAELEGSGASEFFTARVHAALVASGMGMKGELQALDSRALSAALNGVKLVGPRAAALAAAGELAGRGAPRPVRAGAELLRGIKEML